jgi:prophage tail gpP-like protein
MSKAIPGAPYTVVAGDNLTGIAKQAYGDGRRWREIWTANESVLKSGDPTVIFPGEIINIPPDSIADVAELDLFGLLLPRLEGKDPDDFTIVVDDQEIPVISGRAVRAADTAADGWSAVTNFDPEDTDLASALIPYSYPASQCYLGGELLIDGFVYTVAPNLTEKTRTATIEGWSPTVDIIDSTSKPPYEAKNITLEQRARDLVEPLGIKVIFDVGTDEPFDRVTIGNTEKIFDHLAKLATQRGILITSTELGELKFTRAATGSPIGTIEESLPVGQKYNAKFDGRKRFNIYKAIAQTPARKSALKAASKIQVAKDPNVPKSRTLTFTTDETTEAGMKAAAEWKRSKQVADSLTIPFPVSTWYGPDDKLWKENTIVTVVSPAIFVPDGFDFLIRRVEYIFNDKGTTAVLSLVPPQVYTGLSLDEPWAPPSIRQKNLIERITAAVGL